MAVRRRFISLSANHLRVGVRRLTLARLPLVSLAFVLLLAGTAFPAEELLPTTFVVYGKNNDQVIHGDCVMKEATAKVLSCTFSHFSIYPPDPLSDEDRFDLKFAEYGQHPEPAQLAELKNILHVLIDDSKRQLKQEHASSFPPVATQEKLKQYQGMLKELEKDPSKAKSEIDFRNVLNKETQSAMSKAFAQILADPTTGPKRKQLTRQLLEAVSARDFAKMTKLMQEQQQRTCGSWLDTYSLEFHKIGKGKWLSNEGPQGLCRTVTIYELDAEPSEYLLWTFTRKNITTGNASNPLCQGSASEDKNQPTIVYSWKTDHPDFELPCDFIKWLGTGR